MDLVLNVVGLVLQDVISGQLGGQTNTNSNMPLPEQTFQVIDRVTFSSGFTTHNERNHDNSQEAEKQRDSIYLDRKTFPQRFNHSEDLLVIGGRCNQQAAEKNGGPRRKYLSQAALETARGRYVIKRWRKAVSFNLFNIKADSSLDGEVCCKKCP